MWRRTGTCRGGVARVSGELARIDGVGHTGRGLTRQGNAGEAWGSVVGGRDARVGGTASESPGRVDGGWDAWMEAQDAPVGVSCIKGTWIG